MYIIILCLPILRTYVVSSRCSLLRSAVAPSDAAISKHLSLMIVCSVNESSWSSLMHARTTSTIQFTTTSQNAKQTADCRRSCEPFRDGADALMVACTLSTVLYCTFSDYLQGLLYFGSVICALWCQMVRRYSRFSVFPS